MKVAIALPNNVQENWIQYLNIVLGIVRKQIHHNNTCQLRNYAPFQPSSTSTIFHSQFAFLPSIILFFLPLTLLSPSPHALVRLVINFVDDIGT